MTHTGTLYYSLKIHTRTHTSKCYRIFFKQHIIWKYKESQKYKEKEIFSHTLYDCYDAEQTCCNLLIPCKYNETQCSPLQFGKSNSSQVQQKVKGHLRVLYGRIPYDIMFPLAATQSLPHIPLYNTGSVRVCLHVVNSPLIFLHHVLYCL